MQSTRRATLFFLLFVLAFLPIKNAIFLSLGLTSGDCQEFGHIHIYKFHSSAHRALNADAWSKSSSSQTDDDDDECHEAKAVLHVSPFPAAVFDLPPLIYPSVFQIVFHIENHFESPVLEPPRRPPRMA